MGVDEVEDVLEFWEGGEGVGKGSVRSFFFRAGLPRPALARLASFLWWALTFRWILYFFFSEILFDRFVFFTFPDIVESNRERRCCHVVNNLSLLKAVCDDNYDD